MQRYAILDRDGTIIVEKHYLKSVQDLEFLPHAVEGLRALAARGYGLVIITNQSGVGRGLMTVEDVAAIHTELKIRLAYEGVEIAGIYYCPHAPADNCDCRKPQPKLALEAARDFGFDPRDAIVIGDKTSDIELGRTLGARTILVRTGYGRQHEESANADAVVDDLTGIVP